jgi:chromosome segregation ATPase
LTHALSLRRAAQELAASKAALETERSRAGASNAQAEEHATLVAGLQAQLDAALHSLETAESAVKKRGHELAAMRNRADSAQAEAHRMHEELVGAREAAAAAVREATAAQEEARQHDAARSDAEHRLAEAAMFRDRLQARLEELARSAVGAGASLPPAPTGEALLEALEAARRDREYLEGRGALLAADVARLARERNLAREEVETLRSEVRLTLGVLT